MDSLTATVTTIYSYIFLILIILLLFVSHYLIARNEHRLIQYGEQTELRSPRLMWTLTGVVLLAVGIGMIIESTWNPTDGTYGIPVTTAGVGIILYILLDP